MPGHSCCMVFDLTAYVQAHERQRRSIGGLSCTNGSAASGGVAWISLAALIVGQQLGGSINTPSCNIKQLTLADSTGSRGRERIAGALRRLIVGVPPVRAIGPQARLHARSRLTIAVRDEVIRVASGHGVVVLEVLF